MQSFSPCVHNMTFQHSLDPSTFFNIVTNNSAFFLKLANFAGFETTGKSLDPLKKFMLDELSLAVPDEDGFIIERYLAPAKEEEALGRTQSLLYGERGRGHILGSLLDIFVGGTVPSSLKHLTHFDENHTLSFG